MTTSARLRIFLVVGAVLVAACAGSGAGSAASQRPIVPGSPSAAPTGGGSDGSTGSGVVTKPPTSGDPGLPGPGTPTMVVPKPGRLDVHSVGASGIAARVDGRHVEVTLSWWSGVEPCSVLDSVGQVRTGRSIVLTIREGADEPGVACIDIAMYRGTLVDLGELEPGTYTISAGGEASPVRIVVP